MIKNQIVLEAYNKLLETRTVSEANYILTNSLAILGDKKIQVYQPRQSHGSQELQENQENQESQESQQLDKKTIDRINKYKYPERLASFINITNKKTEDWKELSFTKLAFS